MTSDGHAITRLQRLLASGRGISEQIRLLVAELPRRPDLELALAICLALLDREPAVYPRAAARWGSRFALERNLPLVDAQLALAALAVLPGDSGRAGAEALIEISTRSLGTSFVSDLSGGRSGGRALPVIAPSQIRAGERYDRAKIGHRRRSKSRPRGHS
jgi:hypothetical protein